MAYWKVAPEPPTKLGNYRILSSRAGLRVSPICLGAMSIGDKWTESYGSMDKESSFALLDGYYEMGGNFIDTASNYQDESSEEFIGEWAETRGIRDQLVIATKYTTCYKTYSSSTKQKVSYVGNGTKSLHNSVTDSLRKLRTSYIDILYLHWWDYETSIQEVVDSLHNLVVSGKVLYLGISDAPAWVVSQAVQYAIDHGKTPFSVYQGKWNIIERSFERDIIPMARSLGLALTPWEVLGAGRIRSDEEEKKRKESGEGGRTLFGGWERTEKEIAISRVLESVAKEIGAKSLRSVAIAYVMQKTPYVFPVIGGRKIEHLKSNLEALDIVLTPEHIAALEKASPFDPGFPHDFFGDGTTHSFFLQVAAKMDKLPVQQAIRPSSSTFV